MIFQADAQHLPLPDGCVDLIVSAPPAPGNGVWEEDYWSELAKAQTGCLRVLRPRGVGWFLLRKSPREDRWRYFDHVETRWGHLGHNRLPLMPRPGKYWGVTDEREVESLILNYSKPGDVVLDPFCGRGGIPRVARSCGRKFIASDIDAEQLRWR